MDNVKNITYKPDTDGIDHINVYSKAQTKLGRAMSNFAHTPFTHPLYGEFRSTEGFWYWAATGMKNDELKHLYGYEAKTTGRAYQRIPNDNFIIMLKKAILLKFEQNSLLAQSLCSTDLPLTHYYCYGDQSNLKIVYDKKAEWFVQYLEVIRRYLRGQAHKLIIAGSRSITDIELVREAYINSGYEALEIVSGRARGVDQLGEELANHMTLPVEFFPADWDTLGKSAGILRNKAMADYSTALLAVHDGHSVGTKHMIQYMKNLGKSVYVASPL